MTALHKDQDEVDQMPFCDVVDLFKFWSRNPPTHILIGIMAQQKVWKPQRHYSAAEQADAGNFMRMAGPAKPLSKIAPGVLEMFKGIRDGSIPGLKELPV
jgi:hypothetical protein